MNSLAFLNTATPPGEYRIIGTDRTVVIRIAEGGRVRTEPASSRVAGMIVGVGGPGTLTVEAAEPDGNGSIVALGTVRRIEVLSRPVADVVPEAGAC